MIIEICVAVLTVSFLALVVYLVITLRATTATLKKTNHFLSKTEKDLDDLTTESVKLLKNVNDLAAGIRKKSEALDYLISPFTKHHRHSKSEHKHENRHEHGHEEDYGTISELVQFVSNGIVLFNKIRGDIKDYVKSR